MNSMKRIVENLSTNDKIGMISIILEDLKKSGVIRTNNFVGEIGEYKAFDFYNSFPSLQNLQAVNVGTKCVDAINMHNERYSIKTTTTKTTGVFNGCNDKGSKLPQKQLFEYVIIVVLSKNFSLEAIYELDWENFLSLKIWHGGKRTWYLTITKELKRKAKILYDAQSDIAI
ncbi:hypothetical protein [Peribacillus frigoritolerans]|uniref:hypothetical protein n=1 Tax=Peribacillus frigoritolerans TaxID=450367 RepID=UPI00363A1FAA